jgi:hypothetical protein
MRCESPFLNSLIGKRVELVAVDAPVLPPMTLEEVTTLGVVIHDDERGHFFPWSEVVEIAPCKPDEAEIKAQELMEAALEVDSEP